MKNKFFLLFIIILLNLILQTKSFGTEQFNFDVTELEITEEGNIIKGLNRGIITTNDEIVIISDTFVYNKYKNTLVADGNVQVEYIKRKVKLFSKNLTYKIETQNFTSNGNVRFIDEDKNIKIYAEQAVYEKNNEIIRTDKDSKAIFEDGKIITGDKFKYQITENIFTSKGNVNVEDLSKKTIIKAQEIKFFKKINKIITVGYTDIDVQNKYVGQTSDLVYLIDENLIRSKNKTKIINNKSEIYHFNKFELLTLDEVVKGENVLIISNYGQPNSDKYYFTNAIIDLKNKKFLGKDVKVSLHKNIFDNPNNDPRLMGVSSKVEDNLTIVKKGVFTSCKETGGCPPWSIKAKKITHDKNKKQLIYDDAVFKFYKIPVLYFPKFFHPDPTVNRQSGFLKPKLNNSNILGSSLTTPYFNAISDNKDLTFIPTIFDTDMLMSQLEYRDKQQNSSLILDAGFVNNFTSVAEKNKKNFFHFFAKYNHDLKLKNYSSSNINISTERVNNDSYLKLFSPILTDNSVRPNSNKLENKITLDLIHENYNLKTGVETYETLGLSTGDRYQFILPYYDIDWFLDQNYFNGNFILSSNGVNDLNSTNKLETSVINILKYNSNSSLWKNGIKSNYTINLKNVNSVGKNSAKYESSPNSEFVGLFNAEASLPLINKYDDYTSSFLTPRVSFRINPTNMKNYSSSNNKINIKNLFSDDRMGLSDTYEAGRSITLGLDYKKNKVNINDINQYFLGFKLGTVLRDKTESSIPKNSTLNKKHSNLFGSIDSEILNKLKIGYNFSIDNDYSTFEYNDINATFSLNNLVTTFNFIEENNEMGDTNVLTNSISYKYDDKNLFTFKTRRNRKINLTEYYDLVYEYKYDCITAGIKYNKTYYSDSELKPSENLFFTITFIPLTTYEHKDDKLLVN